jgi:catalase
MDESDELKFGFDLLDPTKIVPEDIVPVTLLGKMTLNRNPRNYFAETEQVMFQPGHIVRGIDFTEDPLLQGRIFSYLDTQLNRHGGPNFEQLPINRPRAPISNNNRDGAGQNFIPLNTAAYSPNTLNKGFPKQANETAGRGFFTDPNRKVRGPLVRSVSDTFADVWSQPRLFYNSLLPAEQQFLINAIRFETSHLTSDVVKQNVLIQLNRVSHDVAERVASALGMEAPAPDPKFYHDNTTINVSVFNGTLKKLDFLTVGVLSSNKGMSDLTSFKKALAQDGVQVQVVAEELADGVDMTYSGADATGFDAVVVDSAAKDLIKPVSSSPLFPSGRPWQILLDAYRFGKPVAAVGSGASSTLKTAGVPSGKGVYSGSLAALPAKLKEGLTTFKILGRFPLDS